MGNVNTLIFLVILIVAVGITTLSIFKGKNILGKNVVEGLAVTDTPGWTNGAGYSCQNYVTKGWCKDGKVLEDADWTKGPDYIYPENNCVACGKTSNDQAIINTPGWTNGAGFKCEDYLERKWCKDGKVLEDWATGPKYNYPENNCTVCGKTSNDQAITDTPGWKSTAQVDCDGYKRVGWCKDGKVVPGNEWTVGASFNYPEKNCIVCGKKPPVPSPKPAAPKPAAPKPATPKPATPKPASSQCSGLDTTRKLKDGKKWLPGTGQSGNNLGTGWKYPNLQCSAPGAGLPNLCTGVEYESDGKQSVYCYGDDKGCMWNSNRHPAGQCLTDQDCINLFGDKSNPGKVDRSKKRFKGGTYSNCNTMDGAKETDCITIALERILAEME